MESTSKNGTVTSISAERTPLARMGSSVRTVPVRVEIEPLQGSRETAFAQPCGIARDGAGDGGVALSALPGGRVVEATQVNAVTAFVFQAPDEIATAAHHRRHQPGALREGGGRAQEVGVDRAATVLRHPIARD